MLNRPFHLKASCVCIVYCRLSGFYRIALESKTSHTLPKKQLGTNENRSEFCHGPRSELQRRSSLLRNASNCLQVTSCWDVCSINAPLWKRRVIVHHIVFRELYRDGSVSFDFMLKVGSDGKRDFSVSTFRTFWKFIQRVVASAKYNDIYKWIPHATKV